MGWPRGPPGGGAPCHGTNGTMVNPALSLEVRQMTLIARLRPTVTYFRLDRSSPTDTAHFPFTITSAHRRHS